MDLRLEDGSGLDVVEVLQKHRPEARAVILTGYGAIATAVAAVKAGADPVFPDLAPYRTDPM
jgi:two-component system response regulator RegA